MTDRIDLDDIATDSEEPDAERNRGDWFWRDEGDSGADTDAAGSDVTGSDVTPTDADTDPTDADTDPTDAADGADSKRGGGPDSAGATVPHVPRENLDRPVGIPVEGGGAGGGSGEGGANDDRTGTNDPETGPSGTARPTAPGETDGSADTATSRPAGASEPTETSEPAGASGPHGGGADDMTMAFTYRAATRLADPAAVVADASGWTDWLGVVGDVDAHVINKFQRDHVVDLDFFNGSGTGPAERLAGIDEHSMFYADRMVVVGLNGEDERIAEAAGWEFVPLADAAEKAGWTLREDGDRER